MATIIRTKTKDATVQLRGNIEQAMGVYEEVISGLEQTIFVDQSSEFDIIGVLTNHVTKIIEMCSHLRIFASIDPWIISFIDKVDDAIDDLYIRFDKWTRRKNLSVKDYAKKVGKSVSTIYRWLKQGKVVAKKVNGRWLIADL